MSDYPQGPATPPPAPPDAPGLPHVDMMAGPEMQAWIAKLEAEDRSASKRNLILAMALGAAVMVLFVVLVGIHRATVGAYAVVEDVTMTRHPAHQGQVEIAFRVVTPGKVYYRRTSGGVETELIDYFRTPGQFQRSWAWGYEPGEPVDVEVWSRGGMSRQAVHEAFPTSDRADIVILIDTTGSMSPSIAELKDKCVVFSEKLRAQDLKHRFALIGFGDTAEDEWIDVHGFTSNVEEFQDWVDHVERFDGRDLPESALDALEKALELEFDPEAMQRFYLVTDAAFHEPSRSGATAAGIAAKLEEKRVLLSVFSQARFEDEYRPLLGETGRFQEIENFGTVLSQGRVLED